MDFSTGKMTAFGESPTFSETWAQMEKLLETHAGKVKQIGSVSSSSPPPPARLPPDP